MKGLWTLSVRSFASLDGVDDPYASPCELDETPRLSVAKHRVHGRP